MLHSFAVGDEVQVCYIGLEPYVGTVTLVTRSVIEVLSRIGRDEMRIQYRCVPNGGWRSFSGRRVDIQRIRKAVAA